MNKYQGQSFLYSCSCCHSVFFFILFDFFRIVFNPFILSFVSLWFIRIPSDTFSSPLLHVLPKILFTLFSPFFGRQGSCPCHVLTLTAKTQKKACNSLR